MSVPLPFRRQRRAPNCRCAFTACIFTFVAICFVGAAASLAEEQPAKENAADTDLAAKQAEARAKVVVLTEQLQKKPDDVDALIARASAYYMVEDLEKQEADGREATRLAPKRADAWQALGKAYFAQRNDKEAVTAFDKAVERGAKNSELFFDQGVSFQQLEDHKRAISAFTASLDLKAQNDEAYFGRAWSLRATGDLDKALADFDRAIELSPRQLLYRSERAKLFFDRHEIERGLEDVKEVIRLNPGDLGINYQPTTDKELSAEALAHGEVQVERMLKDRPEMAKHVTKGDKIWTWAVRKFAGEDLGALIDWNAGSPAPFEGCSRLPVENQHAFIQVSANDLDQIPPSPATFDELWSTAVFELNNVRSSPDWAKTWAQVVDKKVQRDDYVLAMLNSEELATQRTRAFYAKYFYPWLRAKNSTDTDPNNWFATNFVTIGGRKPDLAAWGDDPRIPSYEADYDLQRAEREHQQGNYAKVKELVSPYLTVNNSISASEAQRAHYWLGCAECGLDNFDGGVKEFVAALALAPGEAYVLIARGQANQGRSHFDEALADFSEVVGLQPNQASGYYYRGQEYARRGIFDAALQDAEKVLEIDPKADGYLLRAQIWAGKKEFSKSIDDCSLALELAPDNDLAYRIRVHVSHEQKEYDKCLADLEVLLKRNPEDSDLLASRGMVLLLKKSFKSALTDLSRAIELNPNNISALTSRAELLLTSEDSTVRDPDLGFTDAKRACDLTEWKDPYTLALVAQGYGAKKDWDSAVKWQKKALENPNLELKTKWEKALEDFQQQAKGAPDSPTKDAKTP
jgi:tetratricopeptide (TPR) repeat protein